uniref:Ig-like domain-containing protein n=1 Tax=Pundamilia nyererei TaxID=303518 RepID=A0A3B4F152_9CICH
MVARLTAKTKRKYGSGQGSVIPLSCSFSSSQKKNITAESGQDVTLTCRAPHNKTRLVEWSRAEMKSEYVLYYQDSHFYPANQHPSFKNRVDLQDRHMKDGDVSLILKDVTTNDAGTYECGVFMDGAHSLELSIIYLVVPPAASWLLMFSAVDNRSQERNQGNEDLSATATAVFTVFFTFDFYADFKFTVWTKVTDFERQTV